MIIQVVYMMWCRKHVCNRISLEIHCSSLQIIQYDKRRILHLFSLYLYHKVVDLKAATVPHIAMTVETISIIASTAVAFR